MNIMDAHANSVSEVDRFLEQFAVRLQTFRERNNYSQDELAIELGYADKSTISKWESKKQLRTLPSIEVLAKLAQLYHCSLADLLGEFEEESHSSIKFVRRKLSSPLLTPDAKANIQLGVRILTALIEGKGLGDLYPIAQTCNNKDMIFALLRSAILSGEIIFTSVPRSVEIERRLVERFPTLKSAYVVTLPDTMIGEALPPELIAWTAASQLLTQMIRTARVGFGTGYTLYRMGVNTPPSAHQFSGTKWVPLVTHRDEEEAYVYSANAIAAFMGYRQHSSTNIHLPFIPLDQRSTNKQLETVSREWERLDVAFVGGFTWIKGERARVLSSYRRIYRSLESTKQIDNIAGEFLGYILDHDGNVVGGDILKAVDEATTRIPLEELLHLIQQTVNIYFVGGSEKKAPILRAVLKKGYITGLVTDTSLAKALLQ